MELNKKHRSRTVPGTPPRHQEEGAAEGERPSLSRQMGSGERRRETGVEGWAAPLP